MGDNPKSRGNYTSGGWCPKEDCANRNKKCGECAQIQGKYTQYMEPTNASKGKKTERQVQTR